jgi:ABC-type sugar transport system ATPase subunit
MGDRQLIEVARALVEKSKLLVFDEPSATLTDKELEHLFATIGKLRASGMGVVYISHRLEEIFAIADRVSVLRDGEHVATADVKDVTRDRLIQWMVGRSLDEEFPSRTSHPGEVALEVRSLKCRPYFDDATFDVRRGEVVGLAGLVGAGRTSAALTVFGALTPQSGEVILAGRPVRFANPTQALDAGVGYLTEDRKGRGLFESLSVAENMTLSNLHDYRRAGLLSPRLQNASASAARERFNVRTPSIDRPIGVLSGGNQQKALVARLLMRPMNVLLLDEPTRGVDVGAKAEVYRMINELVADGLAVVIISSELPELLGMCDRIVVMREGRTVGALTAAEATQERIMRLATAEVAA